MTSSTPSSSHLLQLIDAMNRCIAPEHHTRILTDALSTAGLVDLPMDRPDFREFIAGPLTAAATDVAGETAATELSWTLMRQTSVRAPSSGRAPSSATPPRSRPPRMGARRPPMTTSSYTDDLFLQRPDVLVIDPDDTLFEELQVHLEARELKATHGSGASVFNRDAPPRLLLAHGPRDDAFASTAAAVRGLGDRAPTVVVVTSDDVEGEAPKHVAKVVAREPLANIVATVLELLG